MVNKLVAAKFIRLSLRKLKQNKAVLPKLMVHVPDQGISIAVTPGVKAWSAEAVKETEFVAVDEPYAAAPR